MSESTPPTPSAPPPSRPRFAWARAFLLLWCGLLGVGVWMFLTPVSDRPVRVVLVLALPALWLGGVFLLRRRRKLAVALLAPGLLLGLFLCLPGRKPDAARLRALYVRHLEGFEGTRYVWGGENGLGIDCSGLVRRALMDAEADLGLRTLNPGLLRSALALWWHDCNARGLRDGYRETTAPLFRAGSINAISDPRLQPGDLAVISSGAHVLAYLGDDLWIEADPNFMKVVRLKTPAESNWFRVPVQVVRWTVLE